MNSTLPKILIGCVILAAAIFLVGHSIRSQDALSSRLPPKVTFADQASAYAGAQAWMAQHNVEANIAITAGTPSMEPYIHGKCWVVIDASVPYGSIRQDDSIEYESHDVAQGIPDGTLVLHVVAKIDRGGFIMSGINNPVSESAARVTPADYRGKLLFVAAWPQ